MSIDSDIDKNITGLDHKSAHCRTLRILYGGAAILLITGLALAILGGLQHDTALYIYAGALGCLSLPFIIFAVIKKKRFLSNDFAPKATGEASRLTLTSSSVHEEHPLAPSSLDERRSNQPVALSTQLPVNNNELANKLPNMILQSDFIDTQLTDEEKNLIADGYESFNFDQVMKFLNSHYLQIDIDNRNYIDLLRLRNSETQTDWDTQISKWYDSADQVEGIIDAVKEKISTINVNNNFLPHSTGGHGVTQVLSYWASLSRWDIVYAFIEKNSDLVGAVNSNFVASNHFNEIQNKDQLSVYLILQKNVNSAEVHQLLLGKYQTLSTLDKKNEFLTYFSIDNNEDIKQMFLKMEIPESVELLQQMDREVNDLNLDLDLKNTIRLEFLKHVFKTWIVPALGDTKTVADEEQAWGRILAYIENANPPEQRPILCDTILKEKFCYKNSELSQREEISGFEFLKRTPINLSNSQQGVLLLLMEKQELEDCKPCVENFYQKIKTCESLEEKAKMIRVCPDGNALRAYVCGDLDPKNERSVVSMLNQDQYRDLVIKKPNAMYQALISSIENNYNQTNHGFNPVAQSIIKIFLVSFSFVSEENKQQIQKAISSALSDSIFGKNTGHFIRWMNQLCGQCQNSALLNNLIQAVKLIDNGRLVQESQKRNHFSTNLDWRVKDQLKSDNTQPSSSSS